MAETALVLHCKKRTVLSMSVWVGGRTLFETKKVSKNDKVVSLFGITAVPVKQARNSKPNKQIRPEDVVHLPISQFQF